jgi:endonuclease G
MRRLSAFIAVVLLLSLTHTQIAAPRTTADSEAKRLARHCYHGCPKVAAAWRRGDTVRIARGAYSLEASTTAKVPLWVAEYVTAAEIDGDAQRCGYHVDPKLRGEPHATVKDYRDSAIKYQIGHQAPAANHKRSQKRMNETFYLGNMAPQVPRFNTGVWKSLETISRKWIAQRGRAWCLTGPVFFNGGTPAPGAAMRTIGTNQIAVPTHFYKIVVAPRRGSTELESIAFLIPNRDYAAPYPYELFMTTPGEIEKYTGIDFMPDLTEAERTRLERTKAPAVW